MTGLLKRFERRFERPPSPRFMPICAMMGRDGKTAYSPDRPRSNALDGCGRQRAARDLGPREPKRDEVSAPPRTGRESSALTHTLSRTLYLGWVAGKIRCSMYREENKTYPSHAVAGRQPATMLSRDT